MSKAIVASSTQFGAAFAVVVIVARNAILECQGFIEDGFVHVGRPFLLDIEHSLKGNARDEGVCKEKNEIKIIRI